MTTLGDFYANLSYGILSNLALGGSASGAIPVEHQPRVLHAIKLGMTALHTKFIMSTKKVAVRSYDGQTLYPLEKRYADTDPTVVAKKFIADSAGSPFLGDVLKVLAVTDEAGCRLPLNDSKSCTSLFTPNPQTLQIPMAVTGNVYFAYYQADHPDLSQNDLTQQLTLSPALHEALQLYVGGQIMSGMKGAEHAGKSVEYFQRYESICSLVRNEDLLSTSIVNDEDKFFDRGFI